MNQVYGIITDRICGLLQQGIVPWERPFLGNRNSAPRGYEMPLGESYHGINRLLLPQGGSQGASYRRRAVASSTLMTSR